MCSVVEAQAVSRAIRAEEALREAEESLCRLKQWYDCAVRRLSEVCAERRCLRDELALLQQRSQQDCDSAVTRIHDLQRQVAVLTSVINERRARVNELQQGVDAVNHERLVARRELGAAQGPQWVELVWYLLLFFFGITLTVAIRR